MAALAAANAAADSITSNQIPWSIQMFGYEMTGGFGFLPAINAQTMEPIKFAFAANPMMDPGRVDGNLLSQNSMSEAYGRYSEVVGSGAFGFMVFVEPVPFKPLFEVPITSYWTVQYFEAGEAPAWDPDSPPPLEEVWFEEDEFPADGGGSGDDGEWSEGDDGSLVDDDSGESMPTEALLAAEAVSVEQALLRYARSRASSSDPVVVMESQLDLTTPEPATFLLVAGGLVAAGVVRRRKRK